MILDRLLCFFGLHEWITTKAHYKHPIHIELASPEKKATRACQVCGKYQEREEHLLGLNPPSYNTFWRTIKKVELNIKVGGKQ